MPLLAPLRGSRRNETMSDKPKITETPKPLGRRYGSVEDLLRGEGVPSEIQAGVRALANETRVSRVLAALRSKAGLTQQEMAVKLGRSQGYVSKLESGRDDDITLAEIMAYAQVLNEPIGFVFGPEIDHVRAIKMHAFAMRDRMMALAKIASQDEQLEREIQKFYGEAFLNIFALMAECQSQLPNGDKHLDFKLEVIHANCHATPNRGKTVEQELVTA